MRTTFLSIATLLLGLSGCGFRSHVNVDYDPIVDFRLLKTYAWAPQSRVKSDDPIAATDTLLQERIVAAVERSLTAKGYRKLGDGNPDFWVAYQTTIKRRVDVMTYNSSFGYGYGMWRYPYAWGGMGYDTYAREYDETTLALDVLRPTSGKLIWRATIRREFEEEATPEQRNLTLQRTIEQMLKRFPPVPHQ